MPSQAPIYVIRKEEMEDQATQEATQQYVDPRRTGTKSMLSLRDEADVLCILLPSSAPALKAVEWVANFAPQHILQNHFLDGIPEASYVPKNEETRAASPDHDFAKVGVSNADTVKGSPEPFLGAARDIALRMSSKLEDPRMGFVFGRVPQRCDLIFASPNDMSPGTLKLSQCHFRIFLNLSGVLMLEDTSTNGTFVDKILLSRSKIDRKGNILSATRMISNGSIIELPSVKSPEEDVIRFIVKIPSRNNGQYEYSQNMAAYLRYIQQYERQAQVAFAAQGKALPVPPMPPMPFNPLNREPSEGSPNASMLAAATGEYNHGAQWNGGEKYNIVGLLGKGAFAMVYRISTVEDGELFAAKEIEKRRFIKDGQLGSKVTHERSIMERLRHVSFGS